MLSSLTQRARRRAGAALVDGFFNTASRLGKLHPQANPERHGVRVTKDVRYAPGTTTRDHLLDVYAPERASGKLPVILYVHGGGFRILSKDTHWIMGLAFARRGYLVFNASYRLAPAHPFPAAVEDVAIAYEWVVRNAHRWGGDPERVAVAGESAGANLATALVAASCYRRPEPFARRVFDTGVVPRAALPACGIYQVSDPDRFASRVSPFVADRLKEVGSAYLAPGSRAISLDLADLAPFFERGEIPDRPLPPFFLPVGTRDPLMHDNQRLANALRALGATVEDRYYDGEHHAFHAFVFLKNARRCWAESYAFLDQHMGVTAVTSGDGRSRSESSPATGARASRPREPRV